MDVYALQPALLHRRGRAAHKGRFAAARAALENDQVVELCIKELFIQPVKTLRAVRAEEEMRMLHASASNGLSFYFNLCAAARPCLRSRKIVRRK